MAVDSKARSKTWHDTLTNQQGRVLEEFLTIHNLHVVNDRSEPTFETIRGRNYVDLTVVNNQLIQRVTDWACGIQESCSDHKIITFNLSMVRQDRSITNTDYVGVRYIVKEEDFEKFEVILASKFNCASTKEGLAKTYQELCDKLNL